VLILIFGRYLGGRAICLIISNYQVPISNECPMANVVKVSWAFENWDFIGNWILVIGYLQA
jgi:hypothetical protein